MNLVDDQVLVHEEPAARSFSRGARLGRGETLRIRARGGQVAMPVDRVLP